jgi:spore maturation protein CgeB
MQLYEKEPAFFENRDVDLVYLGKPHPEKLGRLALLKKRFGERFRVHGRWGLQGFAGWTGLMSGKAVYWRRVTAISSEGRSRLYCRSKIGFNMHVSDIPKETGNMRMYELPACGVMQVCDKAGRDAHASIFVPDREAVFYDDLNDAIERIEYYIAHPVERIQIARAAYERVSRDYDHDRNFVSLIHWGLSLKGERSEPA